MKGQLTMGNPPRNTHFRAVDIALVAVFSALWIVVSLALGPLSFQLTGLPILHDFGVFFTLLATAWITGRFGTSILVGIIGTIIAIPLGAPLLILGFIGSAIVFDIMLILSRHKVATSIKNLAVAALATMFSAYVGGSLIGTLFMSNGVAWGLTVWGGWHLVGGVVAAAVTLPILAGLEKANVRKLPGK